MGDILYGNNGSYFSMRRFEESINNHDIVREKIVARELKFKHFEKIVISAIITLIITLIITIGLVIYEIELSKVYDNNIGNLEIVLGKTTIENNKYFDSLRDKLTIDNIKKIAYLELDMITPSSENTIYFEKRK